MSGRRFALLEPAAGISGDMLLGALVGLGAPRDWLTGLPGRLGLADTEVVIEDVERSGVRATKVTVLVRGLPEAPSDLVERAAHAPQRTAGGSHRHLSQLLRIIEQAPLSPRVKERASATFGLLAEAEGRVHGLPADQVALHEVGAHDALVDIVGAIEGLERLGIEQVVSRPVALGTGWVRAAHGVLAVPTPATSLLLEGLPIAPNGPVTGEATTPTGAALLRVLANGTEPRSWRAERVGWGAGSRDPEAYPNVLKVVLAQSVGAETGAGGAGGGGEAADAVVIATDIDDLSPEYLEPLREALVEAGALDVQSWATQMKKGRIGFRVEVVAPADRVDAVAQAFFRNSSTAGVRWWAARRSTLARETLELPGPDDQRVRIKTLHGPGGPTVKPEYDDVIAVARRTGQPAHEVSRRFQEEALRRVTQRGAAGVRNDHSHSEE
jgi:hypothetical protein